MPTVRIRTHDPDAVSFFTAKLADCGFDVEFAAPGQRVRGDVDLEITVNYTSKSSAARKNTRNSVPLIRPSAPERRIEWTTPYHAEAPELADEFPNSRGGRSDVSKDRELARILAGGTDLIVQLREHLREADLVINIKRIPELTQCLDSDANGLRLGAAVPCYQVYENENKGVRDD